jgi:PAS domain S-box-containing protein
MNARQQDDNMQKTYLDVLDQIEDGYMEVDLSGNIVFVNLAFAKMIGYDRDELKGLNYRAYMSSDSANQCFTAFNKVYRTGLPRRSFIYQMTRKDEKVRHVEYSISLLRGELKEPIGFRSIIRDITEKKRAEKEIANQKSILEATFRSVQEGLITVDTLARIINVNQAALTICGLVCNDNKDRVFYDCSTQCGKSCHAVLSETLKTNRTLREYQINCEHCKRPMQIVKVTSSPLLDNHQQIKGAVLVIRDVTRLTSLEKELSERHHYQNIIGKSEKMKTIFRVIDLLAGVDSTILITGESGTGKEMVAKALHHCGHRALEPMIIVNCAALAENLLESELFGHVKGAFTGAYKDTIGRFQMAEKGTIFLDEIGDISPQTQVKLLRFLQEKQFERVGDSRPIKVDVRVIVATNQDLQAKIASGDFRKDLYYRLKVVDIELPPLRDRKEDIPLLIDHFCAFFQKKFSKSITLPNNVYRQFLEYDWPGNVRELEHAIERIFVLGIDNEISPNLIHNEIMGAATNRHPQKSKPLELKPEDLEKKLKSTDWNVSKTARLLAISRRTLYRKIAKYGLERPSHL